MTEQEARIVFENLRYNPENEVVEFKEAKETYDIDDLGRYFSALSNEANLGGKNFAWIVFGVHDKTRTLVGTRFKDSAKSLQKLKNDMAQHTTGGIIFRDIIPISIEENGKQFRILLFQIPATPRNIVTCWKGIAYGRDGESLKPLKQDKHDAIRFQPPLPDWSGEIVYDATIEDLDEMALTKARIMFAKVHSSRIPKEEVDSWSVQELLQHAGLLINGCLTRTALILLGKPLSAYKLNPAVVEITWILKTQDGDVVDYEHFTIPLIITVDDVLKKIRNITMRELPGGTLFPDTMQQYDDYTIRETLNNCIAHQDYALQQRINFVENDGYLYYENGGTFLPETIENVLVNEAPERFYRNKCLCKAMYHFNMIDQVGRGIQKIFRKQKERHFPMPDYHIDNDKGSVGVTIYGKIIDDAYANMLLKNTNLSLKDCILLDAVQKHRLMTDEAIKYLKGKKLIEGRRPNKFFISKNVASAVGQEVEYVRNKGIDIEKCEEWIIKGLSVNNLSREKIESLISDFLPKGLTPKQKYNKIDYIFKRMRKRKIIEYDSYQKVWKLRK